NLLKKNPGRIDYLSQREIEHPLPVVNIMTKTESKILAEKSSLFSRKSSFSEEMGSFKFSLDDLSLTDNVLLVFEVLDSSGRTMISLNGENIFNGELGVGNPAPITLPSGLLKENNELVFRMSSVGILFWATHRLSLNNVKLVADVTDIESRTSLQTFLVSETELSNLERVVLRFQPDCKYGEVGPLRIVLNGNELYNALPDCDLAFVPIEVSPDLVSRGENKISFSTERGAYLLSHLVVASELKDVEYPTYYFDLSHEDYQEVQDKKRRIRLTMNFVDVTDTKFGEIVLNGYQNHFDTREASLSLDLSDDIVQGTNSVKIKPKKTIEVRELRVDLVN
ncbi:hypothetical protein HYT52_00500, partial [Candidatus Woesearchaeota archaeon]|nr:hypothetical protein [Candidatus Woesearchaeota archaeon]